MKETERLKKVINSYGINQFINIGELYEECFAKSMSFSAFMKNIERATQREQLERIAKGIYCRPNISRYGKILPTEQDILKKYVGDNKGIVVGYSMYNELNISTQVAKIIEVYSNAIQQYTQTIYNIKIRQCELEFTQEVATTVKMFELLKNFFSIQEINYKVFISCCNNFAKTYNENIANIVIEKMKYSKSTIAFMQHILQYYNVTNNLKQYLSEFSVYKYPTMERVYELAQLN